MRKFLVVYEKTKTGYSSYVPDLPCKCYRKNQRDCRKNIFEAIQFHLEGLKADKLRIPKAQSDSEVFVFAVYIAMKKNIFIFSIRANTFSTSQPMSHIQLCALAVCSAFV